ncbi:hypothetical protein Hte_002784 [Hypoxylon texense]
MAFKLPQDVEDETSLWSMLVSGRNMMTEWPETRATIDAFYEHGLSSKNKIRSRGAHFINEDPAVFDAPFFRITAKEASETWVPTQAMIYWYSKAVLNASFSDDSKICVR